MKNYYAALLFCLLVFAELKSQPMACDCPINSELLPYGDFEGGWITALGINNFFEQMGLQECEPLPLINNNGPINNPGIIQDPAPGMDNQVAFLAGATGSATGTTNPESIILPLCRPILSGTAATVSFKYALYYTAGTFGGGGNLQVFLSSQYPCSEGVSIPVDCGSSNTPYVCLTDDLPTNSVFVDDISWNTFSIFFVNDTGAPIDHLIICNNTLPLVGTPVIGKPVVIDDISIETGVLDFKGICLIDQSTDSNPNHWLFYAQPTENFAFSLPYINASQFDWYVDGDLVDSGVGLYSINYVGTPNEIYVVVTFNGCQSIISIVDRCD